MKRKCLKKFLAVGLSCAMIISSLSVTGIAVKADPTIEEMVASARYNLALNKAATANPTNQEGSETILTDGKFTPGGDHAATTFGTANTYYQIDLGTVYDASTIDKLVVAYKECNDGDTPVNGYEIQYSANGLDFTTVKTISGTTVKSQITETNLVEEEDLTGIEGKVRYVRLFYKNSYQWGVQATEIAILDTNGDKTEVEADVCEDAKSVTLRTDDYNQITYRIEAAEGQEGYKYLVYLENVVSSKLIGNGVDAGTDYVVDNVLSGAHTVRVIACYDGAASNGISSESVMVGDISTLIREKRNIANAYTSGYPAKIIEMGSFYEGHSLDTAAKALDGILLYGEGSDAAMRTAAGSPQYFVIDLGEYYTPAEMQELLLAYTNASTYASDTKVEFSLDGEQYTEVGNETGYVFTSISANTCAINRVPLDELENYTEEAVRFVKVTLSGGVSTWGYVINEVSLIANTDEPTVIASNVPEAADVTITQNSFETFTYNITAGEEQEDAVYMVSLGSQIISREAKAGVDYTYEGVDAGEYTLKVCTLDDGWLSKGITKSVTVDGYVNYIGTSLNLALRSAHPEVTVTTDSDNLRSDDWTPIGQDISGGVRTVNDGVWWNYSHHTGYLQTRSDRRTADVDYDLGKDYKPEDIHSVISMYADSGTAATEYEILFSGDGENFESVFSIKDAKFTTFMCATVDTSAYSQETVRYVKYKILDGTFAGYYNDDGTINYSAIGYLLCELAVMGSENLMPEKVTGVTAESPEYNTIVVHWEDVEDENCTYNIYVDGVARQVEIKPGVNMATVYAVAGTHIVKVCSVSDGIESVATEVSVAVETETTTNAPKPTTSEAPTTTKTVTPGTSAGQDSTTSSPVVSTSGNTDTKVSVGKSKIKKAKAGKKKISLTLKKVKGATGYRIKYSTNKKLKKAVTIKCKKVKVTVKKLKTGKKYYFKVQAYKVVNGKTYYGKWSKVKSSKKVK